MVILKKVSMPFYKKCLACLQISGGDIIDRCEFGGWKYLPITIIIVIFASPMFLFMLFEFFGINVHDITCNNKILNFFSFLVGVPVFLVISFFGLPLFYHHYKKNTNKLDEEYEVSWQE